MRRIVPISIVAALFIGSPTPAAADWLSGPIKVMRPDGTVFLVDSPSRWWRDYRRVTGLSPTGPSRCDSCRAPRQAARLEHTVLAALGSRFRAAPRYLILADAYDVEWPHAWQFYPSTDRTPAYVVQDGGIGAAGGRPFKWDVWVPATRRMEQMIVQGPRDPTPDGLSGSDATPPNSPWLWLLLVAIAALAVSGWLYRYGRPRVRPGSPGTAG